MYQTQDFKYLLGIEGLSDALLANHFTLYEGYVNNTNKLIGLLDEKEIGTFEYSELQRRLGWEWNGMRLHELYFENMTKEGGSEISQELRQKMEKIYGSVENWKKSLRGVGLMRGIGWAVLVYDQKQEKLFNVWVNEHDGGHLAGATPLLVMDVFEHAFVLDYGMKRADYIETFFKSIDWKVVSERYENAMR